MDKKILLELADGLECIAIYESEEEAIVDWAGRCPALYVTVCIDGATAKFGPFRLLRWKGDGVKS